MYSNRWWNKATVIQPVEHRSYEVMTEEGQVLRINRRHIRMTKELDEDIPAGEGAYAELNGEPEPTQDENSSAEADTRPGGMPRTPRTSRNTQVIIIQLNVLLSTRPPPPGGLERHDSTQ
ncbi:hypothetical protein F7725_017764 [Dissostichus mawsoni]|uniref:Uncharacterized protein n=1 Tax=Dissostichus mawsoni TaxID=36200 RepID=A0A7J5XR56_DISMA|nr:hypothetical protein F7725_017764 [Dissostichus mawsoni]